MIAPKHLRSCFLCIALLAGIGTSLILRGQQGDDTEARRLYRVGEAALADNDFDIAAQNFEKAAKLAPQNALILLNLAIVQDKQGRVGDARDNLNAAKRLGIDDKSREEAEKLEADLDYKAQKKGVTADTITGMLRDLTGIRACSHY